MINVCIERELERLLYFAKKNELIEELDIVPCRNELMNLFNIKEPYKGDIDKGQPKNLSEILNNILDYALEYKIIPNNSITYRDLLDAKIMGILMPRESEVVKKFNSIYNSSGPREATKYFYNLSQNSNYIRMDRIRRNIYWRNSTEYGELEITINLSKPEKDPKEIALVKSIPSLNYPKCLLCLENVGFCGDLKRPARQNHRVIPIKLGKENWYLQYSPYVYYNEHCILFKEEHEPMSITKKTFKRLIEFVEQIPHYFIGSNAELPIVGGSILNHEHFQGGNHLFPIDRAKIDIKLVNDKYPNIKAGILKWPMSVIQLTSSDKNILIDLVINIFNFWRNYNDETVDILSYSNKSDEKIAHNTITPILRKTEKEEFQFNLVLRNNRTTKKYPEGIFHPHRELHNIKKENIGLIEVMGLAILPGRLKKELETIGYILQEKIVYNNVLFTNETELYKHKAWIEELINKYGVKCSKEESEKYLKYEIGNKFLQVLKDAAVFKDDENGKLAFLRFINSLGFKTAQ